MSFKDLSPELREKAKACTSIEEVLELAKREGHKLSSDELEAISGGDNWKCTEHDWYCTDDNFFGDPREGIDRSRMSAAFTKGGIDARDLDW